MRLGVTGATGFIGRRFVEQAAGAGHHVRCLARTPLKARACLPSQVEIHPGDLADLPSIESFVQGLDCIVHLAASVGTGHDYFVSNVLGSENICKALKETNKNCLLVYASSIAVLRRYRTFDCLNTEYARSKAAAEEVVRRFEAQDGLRVVYVYPGLVYGPGDRKFFPALVHALKKKKLPQLSGGEKWAPLIHVDDMADLLLHLVSNPSAAGRSYIGVGRQEIGIHELCKRLAQAFDVPPPSLKIPKYLALSGVLLGELMARLLKTSLPPLVSRRVVDVLSINFNPATVQEFNRNEWTARCALDESLEPTLAWLRQEGLV